MELQVQAVDHERSEIECELDRMSEVTSSEQQKHRNKLEKTSSVGEEELTMQRTHSEDVRA